MIPLPLLMTITIQCLSCQLPLLLVGYPESTSIINTAMTHLKSIFPKCSFYGKGSPQNITTDDSQAGRSGLKKKWPNTSLYLCVFHFLQTMWRWLLHSNNGIHIQHRQHLMQLIRNMVYSKPKMFLIINLKI